MNVRCGRLLRAFAIVALSGAMLSAAVGATDVSPSQPPATEMPSPPVDAVSEGSPWGPLALVDDLEEDVAPISGTLSIGEACVTLRLDDASELALAWRGSKTDWDASAGRVQFDDVELGVIELADGDRVSLGGVALGPSTPGSPKLAWLQGPAATCLDETWLVHRVYPEDVASIRWGPLAVADDPEVPTLIGTGAGRLVIGEACVTLRIGDADPMTLVWPGGQTRWRPGKQRIVFDDPRRGTLRLVDGDRMSLGGARVGSPDAASSTPGDSSASAPAPIWLREPAVGCPEELFVIEEVNPKRR